MFNASRFFGTLCVWAMFAECVWCSSGIPMELACIDTCTACIRELCLFQLFSFPIPTEVNNKVFQGQHLRYGSLVQKRLYSSLHCFLLLLSAHLASVKKTGDVLVLKIKVKIV